MKPLLLVTILLLFACTTVTASNAVLLGLWKSDAAQTIASYKSTKTVSAEGQQSLERMFGKITLNFGAKEVLIDGGVPGVEAVSIPFRIRDSDGEHIVVEFLKPDGSVDETAEYHFEGDCMKRQQEWYEYFCQVQ